MNTAVRTPNRNGPTRGTSNAPSVNLAGLWKTKWAEKAPFGNP